MAERVERGGRWALLAAGVACGVLSTSNAEARPPRDYFLDPPAPGLFANVDVFSIGVQGAIEHRLDLDGNLTQLVSRFSGLASLGFGDVGGHVDFRVLFLSVGASAGVRRAWRNYQFAKPGENTRDVRIKMDRKEDGVPERNVADFPWQEGRARLVVPLDYMWLVTGFTARNEGAPENSYDWFSTNVHSGGMLYRADATLFYRHERFGAIGPAFRYMNLPTSEGRKNEIAFGLTFGTRPMWKRNSDLFLFQFLTAPTDDTFGFHVLRTPIYAMLIYRMTFGLSQPEPF